jgi:hypothetical protein
MDPRVVARIVEKAHAAHLRVSVHVNTAADFHNALLAGADEIAHIPLTGITPIAVEDAELAAKRGVVVDTTCEVVPTRPPFFLPKPNRPLVLKNQLINLKLLHDHGVKLAIGTDIPPDTSRGEVEYLRGLKVFDDLTLLNTWTNTTPQSIFPERRWPERQHHVRLPTHAPPIPSASSKSGPTQHADALMAASACNH